MITYDTNDQISRHCLETYFSVVTILIIMNICNFAAFSSAPDYTLSMATDFIEKLKCRELESNERKNRAPFLACLRLEKMTREKLIQTSSTGNSRSSLPLWKTPCKIIIAKLSIRKRGSSSVLILALYSPCKRTKNLISVLYSCLI